MNRKHDTQHEFVKLRNAVTLVVLGGFGSCFDVVMAHEALCTADTSGMPEYHVFTSMHARSLKQWLESL